jgi:predicted HTH transcriptional regulator
MAGVITEEALKAKIETTEGTIRRLVVRRKELEAELKVYRRLLQDFCSEGASNEQPTASEAILAYLERTESATTAEIAQALHGKFQTQSEDPRSAIYAAIAALKERNLIESLSGDGRRYRKVENELEPDVQRAAS